MNEKINFFININMADVPWFTARLVLGIDTIHAALKVKQSCDGLLETFSVILVFTAFLKLL